MALHTHQKIRTAARLAAVGAATLSLLIFAACGEKKKQADRCDTPPSNEPKAMALNDLDCLSSVSAEALANYDQSVSGRFSQVFGGTTSAHLRSYYDARMKHIWTKDDLNLIQGDPGEATHVSWQKSENEDGNEPNKTASGNEVYLNAMNLGMALWFQGVVDGRTPEFSYKSTYMRVDNPRVGIMMLGPGYMAKQENIKIPTAYRQATLLHEARHSDCTGGITDDDIEIVRKSKNMNDFQSKWKSSCGHMHTLCPKGHEYAGIAACDRHAWGAYTVSAMFDSAVAPSLKGLDRRIMEAMAIDAWSRVLVGQSKMFRGDYGQPDMSSSGHRRTNNAAKAN